MRRLLVLGVLVAFAAVTALGQGAMADFLAGNLVNPKEGQWSWYDIAEKTTGLTYSVRQAIVGTERVGRKTGHWFEMEVVPPVGYALVYRMLLTGPASDPKNIHKMIVEDGMSPAREIPVDNESAEAGPMQKAKRTLAGKETVQYLKGTLEAEHYVFDAAQGKIDVWINEEVGPTGIVRITSDEADLILRDFGVGGEDGRSAPVTPHGPKSNISIKPRVTDDPSSAVKPRENVEKKP